MNRLLNLDHHQESQRRFTVHYKSCMLAVHTKMTVVSQMAEDRGMALEERQTRYEQLQVQEVLGTSTADHALLRHVEISISPLPLF